MSPLPLLAQQSRLARGSFVLAAITVYALSLASQTLLSAPVVAQVGVAPFVLVQIALIWVWIVLHMRRLRDAGRPNGLVIGVALIYALEVVLLTLLVWILNPNTGISDFAGSTAGVFHLFVILYLFGAITGDPNLGALQLWLMGFAVLMFLPVVIATLFSLWVATRPSNNATSPP